MIKTILITGGTGFVGKGLVKLLLEKGYSINLLVRGDTPDFVTTSIKTFKWDVYDNSIDKACIRDVGAIIHLAGEDIAAKRWTEERKTQIIESRTKSIRLIYDLLRKNKNQVKHIISASAVGYYGDRSDELLDESSLPSKDFLAETCIEWEEAVNEGKKFGLRIVNLRSGIILGKQGGILPQMNKFLRFGLCFIPGSGSQWVSWIHYDDAINIYAYALEKQGMEGVYNMVSPEPMVLTRITRSNSLANGNSPLFIHVPEFVMKIAIGEMSLIALESSKVSSRKLENSGYQFKYRKIDEAMKNIYANNQ